jgi:hypothetical protein
VVRAMAAAETAPKAAELLDLADILAAPEL